jgi:hypothetical protein
MNKLLKAILLLLGIGLVGYAVYFKMAVIESSRSTSENTLLNATRFGSTEFSNQFNRYSDSMSGGWTPIIVMGLAIIIVAAGLKSSPKP